MALASRRERPPSGHVNRPKTAGPVPSARMLFSARNDSSPDVPEVPLLIIFIANIFYWINLPLTDDNNRKKGTEFTT